MVMGKETKQYWNTTARMNVEYEENERGEESEIRLCNILTNNSSSIAVNSNKFESHVIETKKEENWIQLNYTVIDGVVMREHFNFCI